MSEEPFDLLVDFKDDAAAEYADDQISRFGAFVIGRGMPSGMARHEGHYGVRVFNTRMVEFFADMLARCGGKVIGRTDAFMPKL